MKRVHKKQFEFLLTLTDSLGEAGSTRRRDWRFEQVQDEYTKKAKNSAIKHFLVL